jgi:hypothetical protein
MRRFNPWLIGALFGALIGIAHAQNSTFFPSGGGGGSPGGTNTQVQFNNSGAFGGDSGFTYAGSGNATLSGTLTLSKNGTAGAPSLFWSVDSSGLYRDDTVGGLTLVGAGAAFHFAGSPNPQFIQSSSSQVTWTPSSITQPPDTFLSRAAAASLQLGNFDVAAPTAQTLTVQNVIAGTTNTAGTNWTFSASKGTGTGVGGNIILQTAPAGTTGSAQNSLIQVEVIDSNGHIRVGNQTAPALTSCGTSPSIVGDDTAGTVTMGTGTPTGCVITFKTAYANTPICVVVWPAQILASQSYAVSTTAITTTQTATSSNKVNYICRAQNGG